MKKLLLMLVFLVAFNGMFFLLCEDKNTGVWISYGFVHFAFLLLLVTPLLCSKGKSTYILNAAIYSRTISYFLLELVAGTVFVCLQLDNILWPLLVQGILWLVHMTVILINAWANDDTARSLQKREQDLQPLKDSMIKLKLLSIKVKDAGLRKEVTDYYNELYYSSTRQTEASVQIDSEIAGVIAGLDAELRSGNDRDTIKRYIEQLSDLVRERKEIVKQYSN